MILQLATNLWTESGTVATTAMLDAARKLLDQSPADLITETVAFDIIARETLQKEEDDKRLNKATSDIQHVKDASRQVLAKAAQEGTLDTALKNAKEATSSGDEQGRYKEKEVEDDWMEETETRKTRQAQQAAKRKTGSDTAAGSTIPQNRQVDQRLKWGPEPRGDFERDLKLFRNSKECQESAFIRTFRFADRWRLVKRVEAAMAMNT